MVKEVAKITKGAGVDVIFDPVGKDTYEISLGCLKDRGLLASFGGASGPVPLVDLNEFRYMARAWTLTRASLFNWTANRRRSVAQLQAGVRDDPVRQGEGEDQPALSAERCRPSCTRISNPAS